MALQTILLLEDDPVLGEGISLQLELAGFNVQWSKTVREAMDAVQQPEEFAAVLLDLSLPDGSGIELCQMLRSRSETLPIVFLTARTDEESVVHAFEVGANDYIRKPFGNRELMARLKNLIPKQKASQNGWKFQGAVLLKDHRKVVMGAIEIHLNRREYEVLCFLFQNPERIVSRERLVSEIDRDGEIFDRTIDSHVSHIRSKLRRAGIDQIRIESIYGEGYRLGTK